MDLLEQKQFEKFEEQFVSNVYNEIAVHFDETRVGPWDTTETFIKQTGELETIYEAGCGNGKNMLLKKLLMKGSDTCEKFVEICKMKNLNVELGDVCDIKEEDESYSHAICIAVIHHLSSEERRLKALNELCRIVKKGGRILISVWGFEANVQTRSLKSKLLYDNLSHDQIVTWKRKDGEKFNRYYHFFTREEIVSLCEKTGMKILTVIDEAKNWKVILEKI
jgi:tRNA (uracil-5-)-methyltransferase TRM9